MEFKNNIWNNLESEIAYQCAPVILGIKVANLLIIEKINHKHLSDYIEDTDIRELFLCENKNKVFYFVYCYNNLLNHLNKKSISKFLNYYGYKKNLEEMLDLLKCKFIGYYNQKNNFPHEIGVFLGYPINDVKAFIKYKGKKSILSGYWKVYYQPEKAVKVFDQYNKAREDAVKAVLNGYSLNEYIIKVKGVKLIE